MYCIGPLHIGASKQKTFFKNSMMSSALFFFFQAEDGIRDLTVTGVQTCALPICRNGARDFRRRPQQVVDEGIHRSFHRAPGTGAPLARHAVTGLAVLADDLPGADRKSVV